MFGSNNKLPVEFELENGQMNKMNADFLSLIEQLKTADDTAFTSGFVDFVKHTEKQFAEKDDWMKASRFSQFDEYSGEHARVLSGLKSMLLQVKNGQLTFARAWINEQALEWFTQHLMAMDTALSNHLQSLGSGRATSPQPPAANRQFEEEA